MADDIQALLSAADGVLTSRQAEDVGISRLALTRAVRAGELERIGRGVYAAPDAARQPAETYRLKVIGTLRRRRHDKDAASHHAALAPARWWQRCSASNPESWQWTPPCTQVSSPANSWSEA